MSYSFLNQPVLTSELCFQRDVDSFFSPVALQHTGFAFDGYHYTAGVKGTAQASWSTEVSSGSSGILPSFPTQCLVIISRAVISLVDATTEALSLWKLFYFADQFGYTDNSQGGTVGYLASAVSWNNGLLSVTMSPDTGSVNRSPNVLTLDFVQDSIYFDTTIAP